MAPVPAGLSDFQALESEQLLGLLEDPVLAFDAAGRVVAANPAGAELAAGETGAVEGAGCRRALPAGEGCREGRRCVVHQALDTGRPASVRRRRAGGVVLAEAALRSAAGATAVVYRERPAEEHERLECELADARHAVDAAHARASELAARTDAVLRAASSLRSAEGPEAAVERAVEILCALPELRLAAVGLAEGGAANAIVQGLVRRASGRLTPLRGRALLLDLMELSPERRRVGDSFVFEGFHAAVQRDSGLAESGDWDLTLVFDGEPTMLTPLTADGRSLGLLVTKPALGQRVDESFASPVELLARALTATLDGLDKQAAERRRLRLAATVTRLGRRLLGVRDPERVLEETAAALGKEWPRAALEWTRYEPRPGANPPSAAPGLLGSAQLLRERTAGGFSALAAVSARISVPVRTAAGLRAQLSASAPDAAAFGSLEKEDLESLAKVVAGAYANAELFQREERSLEGLAVVARVGRLTAGSLETDDILGAALGELCGHRSFETVAVGLVDRSRGKLVLKAQASRSGVKLRRGLASPIDQGLTGAVIRGDRALLVNDVAAEPLYHEEAASTRSELCVPLRVLDRVVGVLDVQCSRTGAFDEEDLVVAEAVADHLARALHDAKLYETVKAANRELRESERRKTDFLATVAHDLRTPLTSIRSAADVVLMYDGAPAEETNEFLVAIRDESARLGRLVDDFLAQARIEGGELEFEVVEFRLDDQLRHFARLFEGQAARRGIKLECRMADQLPMAVGDPERVSQVVANLLSNATKFTPEGGDILLTARALPAEDGQVLGQVLVEVADSGEGIQEQDRERVFERFVRVDADPRGPRGAGLGLPIARSLIEHQGGRLWCEGRDGGGSVFRFTLPVLLD